MCCIKHSILVLGFAVILIPAIGQDCKLTANAGPGINVCTGGAVQLHGTFEGDAKHAEWQGGKGTFTPSRLSVEAEYTPAEEETGTQVTLTFVVTPANNCPVVKHDLVAIVNDLVKVDAGKNQTVCKGNKVQLNGSVTGKAMKTTWVSNGSGKFDDANKLNAIYTPSEKDEIDGGCSIRLIADPFGVCPPDESAMIVMIKGGVDYTLEDDKFVSGKEVELSIDAKDKPGKVEWTSEGTGTFTGKTSPKAAYNPSLEDIQKGNVRIQVAVTDQSGSCTSKKDVVVHLNGGN